MSLVPSYIESLRPYVPGKSIEEIKRTYGLAKIIKLASNENPLGASPKALEEVQKSLATAHLYPDGGWRLRSVLAERFKLKLENVIAGAGSEGIMSNIIRTFLADQDEVLTAAHTFLGFMVLARSRGVKIKTVKLTGDWRFDLAGLAKKINKRTKIIYLANPNNPTGTIFARKEFERFLEKIPERLLVILDEAYFEFAQENSQYPDSMTYRHDNVITLRTFSKAYGLAGFRIGYGFAHGELVRNLLKVKLPFEPSHTAEAAGIGALEDAEFLEKTLANNRKGRKFLLKALTELGFNVLPSDANFVLVLMPAPQTAQKLFLTLLAKGIIVRPQEASGLPQGIRISVGGELENEILIETLEKIMKAQPVAVES
ncbi:MAG: histidinol-phosphate transaminase [candidate division Zixibacteria bacterium]|nr:histidinol-phosphate transaminase [candidate division Zixibacteria bacterium]MCI0596039.1 histidinol-phosphate transaminase [candidate division Zixibacteria bacterium]